MSASNTFLKSKNKSIQYRRCSTDKGAFLSVVVIVFLCFGLGSQNASAQKNYLFRVQSDHVQAVTDHVERSGGTIRDLIELDTESLVSANGPSRVKSQIRRLDGVLGVADDIEYQGINPALPTILGVDEQAEFPEKTKDDDFFHELQWGHSALNVHGAWKKAKGEGVKVAILDNGIDGDHKDLEPNLRADLSKSFVPGEDWTVGDGFYFNHGTHVAGIIGAADNGYGVIGVAPDVELIALKVLSEHTDSGDFSWLMAAIVYAANQGIDIANISIGTILPENGAAAANTSELKAMFDSVSRYANERGLFIVASAGEQHQNLDRSQVHFPSVTEHIVSVASTTPIGWLVDPYTSFFNGSSYSNYGRTGVDFVAPGGDASYPGEENCQLASIERPCWVFDFAFSTISDGWGWVTNTGAATAHAAGVAALYKSLHPDASPEDIRAALKGSAYKIGATPGKDEVFGGGHLNALGALSIHNNKSFALHQQESESFTLVREEIPTNFELTQNYPNPFNPLTTINFHLPEQSQVYVGVYDVQGRQVATLVDNELKAGCYDTYWNGRDENGNTVESGVYMYKIIANNYVDSKVMTFSNN